jgi:type IV pilus assembly protein PilC
MQVFKYRAVSAYKKIVTGFLEADAEDNAASILREKGLTIISLQEERVGGIFNLTFARIKPKDVVIFSRQFSVLVSANVSLVESLRILVDQTRNLKLKTVIAELADEVSGGSRLSDALQRRDGVFSDFYINVIRSGESSGKLDDVLIYLADELEKDYDMNSKIKGAMIYPAFVIGGILIVGFFMMAFVVPKLTEIFVQSGVELPIATKILVAVSGFIATYWWLVGIITTGLGSGLVFFARQPLGRAIFDDLNKFRYILDSK